MQNRPPGAVTAINNLYARAAVAVEKGLYRYRALGNDRYDVANVKNGHRYTVVLKKANCNCVDNRTNIYKIPCIHALVLILRLNLNWDYFDLSVRRNIRNTLIKPTDDGWQLLGPPEGSEDIPVEKFWEQGVDMAADGDIESPDSKEALSDFEGVELFDVSPIRDEMIDTYSPMPDITQPVRLATGKSEKRLVRQQFQKLHDSAARLKDTFYNMQGAFQVSSNKDLFALEWIEKMDILTSAEQMLSQLESMMMLASGGTGKSYPVVSSLEAVQARNKTSRFALRERRPLDVQTQRQNRRRMRETMRSHLDSLQTPLVEANRPNKKRKSEASRNQKNYKRAADKARIPLSLHRSLNPNRGIID